MFAHRGEATASSQVQFPYLLFSILITTVLNPSKLSTPLLYTYSFISNEGLDGVDNDWLTGLQPDQLREFSRQQKRSYVSFTEWDSFVRSRGLTFANKRYSVEKHKKSSGSTEVLLKAGSTMYLNCFHQYQKSANPAHWMMKLGPWYEIALWKSSFPEQHLGGHKTPPTTPFDHVYLHQCTSPVETNWKWGVSIFDITKRRSDMSNLTNEMTSYTTLGYEHNEEAWSRPLTCYDDLFAVTRQGVWFRGREPLVMFRRDSAELLHEPQDAIINPEPLELDELGYDITPQSLVKLERANYCAESSNGISRARIKIFERTATTMLRKFLNMDEVIELVQNYTSVPIEIITVNDTTSVVDQIRVFNSFDVLITSHGSQLANGIFTTNPESKAVIEVDPFAFDPVFYNNFNNQLGFAEYMISTGHLTPGRFINGERAGLMCPFGEYASFQRLGCKEKPLIQNVFKVRDSFFDNLISPIFTSLKLMVAL